jgi:hypothetical protein
MKFRTVTERIGERVGDIDWSFDFLANETLYNGCADPAERVRRIQQHVDALREADRRFKADELIEVRINDYWKSLLNVGMYDGWPFWRPYPSVLTRGVLGSEWHPWSSLEGVRTEVSR